MKNVYLITAMDNERGIGKNNQLPWKISADLKYFQKMTMQCKEGKRNAVIMGRRTFESIGCRILKGRLNIILSSQQRNIENDSVRYYSSLKNAINECEKDISIQDIYIIGGQQIYETALLEDQITGIYITQIYQIYDCDRFFPNLEGYHKIKESEPYTENDISFTYQYWVKDMR